MAFSISRSGIQSVDDGALLDLVSEGESLWVERKEQPPEGTGLGAVVASFANGLGGWLLIGLPDEWRPGERLDGWVPRSGDLQTWLSHALAEQIDPVPAFTSRVMELEGKAISVVRVPESPAAPHVERRKGRLWTRAPGGKRQPGGMVPVERQDELLRLVERGRRARAAAAHRLELDDVGLQIDALLDDDDDWSLPPDTDHPSVVLIEVVATPIGVPAEFASSCLTRTAVERFADAVKTASPASLAKSYAAAPRPSATGFSVDTHSAPGLVESERGWRVTGVVDAAGLCAMQLRGSARYPNDETHDFARSWLERPLHLVSDYLMSQGAAGELLVVTCFRAREAILTSTVGGTQLVADFTRRPHSRSAVRSRFELDPLDEMTTRRAAERWAREIMRAGGADFYEPEHD